MLRSIMSKPYLCSSRVEAAGRPLPHPGTTILTDHLRRGATSSPNIVTFPTYTLTCTRSNCSGETMRGRRVRYRRQPNVVAAQQVWDRCVRSPSTPLPKSRDTPMYIGTYIPPRTPSPLPSQVGFPLGTLGRRRHPCMRGRGPGVHPSIRLPRGWNGERTTRWAGRLSNA